MIVGFRGVSWGSVGSRGIRWVFVSFSSGKKLNMKYTIVGFHGFSWDPVSCRGFSWDSVGEKPIFPRV